MEIHKKIHPQFFKDVVKGIKNFEYRKDEDNIQPGDILVLEEYEPQSGYTGLSERRVVKYVLRNAEQYGLPKEYCVIGW